MKVEIKKGIFNEDNKDFFSFYFLPTIRFDRWWKGEYCLFLAFLFWEIWITNKEYDSL